MADEIIKGLSRLAYQFQSSVNLQGFLTAFLQEWEELAASELQLLNERYLDTAVGVQLDGIGEILGLPRPSEPIALAGLFGFDGDDTALGFGDATNALVGGNWWDGVTPTAPINDELYRLLLRAKAIQNQTAMTVDDTLRLISFVFGGVLVRYFQNPNLEPIYAIYKNLSPLELNILKDLPVLIGIEKAYYVSVPDDLDEDIFSFDGDPDPKAAGFGDANNPNVGGIFSQVV